MFLSKLFSRKKNDRRLQREIWSSSISIIFHLAPAQRRRFFSNKSEATSTNSIATSFSTLFETPTTRTIFKNIINMTGAFQIAPHEHHPASLRNREPIWEKLGPVLQDIVADSTCRKAGTSIGEVHVLEVASGTGAHVEFFHEQIILKSQSEVGCTNKTAPSGGSSNEEATIQPFMKLIWQQTEKTSDMAQRITDTMQIAERNDQQQDAGTPSTSTSLSPSSSFSVVRPPLVLDLLNVGDSEVLSTEGSPSTQGEGHPLYDLIFACNVIHISEWTATENLFRDLIGKRVHPRNVVIYGPFKRYGEFTTESNADFDTNLKSRDPSWGLRDLESVEKLSWEVGYKLKEVHEMPANNFLLRFDRDDVYANI
ncbi:unnamed protein product [Amoebophrya sp. A25]|nr:unnamed protein product [Amoebophrya sp. A25]|eukprot:GSA25T00022923001.1